MNTQELKKIADEHMKEGQALMSADGFLSPIILAIDGKDEIETFPLIIENDEDVKKVQEFLNKLAETYEALLLIMPANHVDLPEGETLIGLIEDHPDSSSSITCFLYTKSETHVHRMPYIQTDKVFSFHDIGWESITEYYENYKNPFTSKKVV